MKVFLDTNILLDLLLEREGFEDSARILGLAESGKISLYVSALTMVNVAYVYQKTVGKQAVIPNLKVISSLMKVLPIDDEVIQTAIYLEGKDFEDVLQVICAARANCDVIITRNIKDFSIKKGLADPPPLPQIMTPGQFQIDIK